MSPICHAQMKGGKSIWLTGDAGLPAERWLLGQSASFLKADYLKVGHHGSKGSSGPEFLRATGAKVALIAVGKNRYGHPHPEVMGRLKDLGITPRRTDQEGSILKW